MGKVKKKLKKKSPKKLPLKSVNSKIKIQIIRKGAKFEIGNLEK